MKDFDWWLERLTVDRVNNDTMGARDLHAGCPSCGSRDNLHVTEKNGKALLRCFGCNAPYNELEEAVDAPVVKVTRKKRSTTSAPTAKVVNDPIEWYASYCNVDRTLIESLGIVATDGWVAHTWPGTKTQKLREPNGKQRRWTPKGGTAPRLWPSLPDDAPEEIWLCEGESDVIVGRAMKLPTYTAGSATTLLTSLEMRALRDRGVERITICYDTDKEGQKATEATLKAAQAAGIIAVVVQLGDPIDSPYKDLRAWWNAGNTTAPETSTETALDQVWGLHEIAAATDTDLLLGYLHPTDHTILFGDGGTGKGVIAAWWAAQLTQLMPDSKRILVLDYEAHAAHEWRPRVERFKGDLHEVFVRQFVEPIWDVAGDVRGICDALDIDYVIVDSVAYACVGEEPEKSVTAARYSMAISQIGRPTLSLAHVTKADTAEEAKHPFGSIFWSNGARITIHVSNSEYDSPRVLRNRKTNQRAPFKPSEIDWTWVDGELPDELHFGIYTESAVEYAKELMMDGVSRTAQEISEASGGTHDTKTVRNALKRDIDTGKVFGGMLKLDSSSKPEKYTYGYGIRRVKKGDA